MNKHLITDSGSTEVTRYKSDCSGSGNHLCNFYEVWYRCDNCCGTGWLTINKEELKERLYLLYQDFNYRFSQLLNVYHYWKK